MARFIRVVGSLRPATADDTEEVDETAPHRRILDPVVGSDRLQGLAPGHPIVRIRAVAGRHEGLAPLLHAVGAAKIALVFEPDHAGIKGWDAYDALAEGWTGKDASAWMTAARVYYDPDARALPTPTAQEPETGSSGGDAPPPAVLAGDGPGDAPPPARGVQVDDTRAPVPLGYDRDRYYYWSCETRQVHVLTPGEHTAANLSSIASQAGYWENSVFFTKNGVAWAAARDHLMSACKAVGVFDPARIRGRGACLDDGRVVMHLDNRLLVDGAERPVHGFDSDNIYEVAGALEARLGPPLSTKEAHGLADVCAAPLWEEDYMGKLFAGWLVIAPVCGAMAWRPHLWMIGPAGSGKTWILDNITRPCLGPVALTVSAKTTEAYIRAKLQTDALPVLFEEAETQGKVDRLRMQGVLDLARQASSENAPTIGKSNSLQQAIDYRIRSCMMLQSINLALEQAADQSRFAVLKLQDPARLHPDEREMTFAALKERTFRTITADFGGRLLARTLKLLPVIRQNAERFAQAAAEIYGSRRQGDTLGTLLAGLYSLHSAGAVTEDQARAFVAERDWIRASAAETRAEADHDKCLAYLLEQSIRTSPTAEPLIAELLAEALATDPEAATQAAHARVYLGRWGLRIDGEDLCIARSHEKLKHLFRDTAWPDYGETLLQHPMAVRGAPMKFGARPKRPVRLPLEVAMGGEMALSPG